MSYNRNGKAVCDMVSGCSEPVTHIGEKGYVYCAKHVSRRQGVERCRKMRAWELELIHAGRSLPSYEPISREEIAARIRCAGCGLKRRDIEEPSTGDLCGCAFTELL